MHDQPTPTTALARYDAARIALQDAASVDEVKDIRDKALAMAAYAKQANDTKLIEWATEIRVRAERRAGEMLAAQKAAGMMAAGTRGQLAGSDSSGGRPSRPPENGAPTLAEIGISKDQSSRWQKLAAIPEDQFEQAVEAAKEVAQEVTTSAIFKAARAERKAASGNDSSGGRHTRPPEDRTPEYDPRDDELAQAHDTINALSAEIEALRDGRAIEEIEGADERQSAAEIIAELRETTRQQEEEIAALKSSRDRFQAQAAELVREVRALRRRLGESQ